MRFGPGCGGQQKLLPTTRFTPFKMDFFETLFFYCRMYIKHKNILETYNYNTQNINYFPFKYFNENCLQNVKNGHFNKAKEVKRC